MPLLTGARAGTDLAILVQVGSGEGSEKLIENEGRGEVAELLTDD